MLIWERKARVNKTKEKQLSAAGLETFNTYVMEMSVGVEK